MMNDDMLRNIEYLREKADVSYEEASELLKKFDGNVMRALVELERQGRVYPQGAQKEENWHEHAHQQEGHHTRDQEYQHAKKHASSFISQALQHRLVIESGKGANKKTIANVSVPYIAVASVLAPYVAIPSVGLMFLMGYRVKVEKQENGPRPEDVEEFVDKTVTSIKKTASSITETVRKEKCAHRNGDDDHDNQNDHDDHDNCDNYDNNDEGGEVTIE